MDKTTNRSLNGHYLLEESGDFAIVYELCPLEVLFETVQDVVFFDYLGSFLVSEQKQLTIYELPFL